MTKAIVLISAGIDSPVATWIMKQRGLEIVGLHFATHDETSKQKTKKICEHLGIKKTYFIKHKKIITDELVRNCANQAICVLCKRMMIRLAEKVAELEDADFLLTGDNLGQVASQTLDNMVVISKATKMQILRPLLCYDKQEIVDIAKDIGTYELSIAVQICCTAVPKMPLTKAKLYFIEKEEEKIDMERVVKEALESAEKLEL